MCGARNDVQARNKTQHWTKKAEEHRVSWAMYRKFLVYLLILCSIESEYETISGKKAKAEKGAPALLSQYNKRIKNGSQHREFHIAAS